MSRFLVQWRYASGVGGPWEAGDVVDIDDPDVAAHINRDSPGVLAPVTAAEAQERALDAAPHDRMVKQAQRRQDRQGDASDQGAMSRADFKALKDR